MTGLIPPFDGYQVRSVPGMQARKPYVCPSCHNGISTGEGHVVAWPEGDAGQRRHWHRHCWRLAVRRGRLSG